MNKAYFAYGIILLLSACNKHVEPSTNHHDHAVTHKDDEQIVPPEQSPETSSVDTPAVVVKEEVPVIIEEEVLVPYGPVATVYPSGGFFFGGGGGKHHKRRGVCGNGRVEGGEQCDDGNRSNADNCTAQCRNARCNDGFLNLFTEQCDPLFAANYNISTPCNDDCTIGALRAFVTSDSHTGDLIVAAQDFPSGSFDCELTNGGGVAAANCLCRQYAANVTDDRLRCSDSMYNCWKAWIADSSSSPASNFQIAQTDSTVPIYQVNENGEPDTSAPIATGGWEDLIVCDDNDPTDACLDDEDITTMRWRNEEGDRVEGDVITTSWTAVTTSGSPSVTEDTCNDWSSESDQDLGQIGEIDDIGDQWTEQNGAGPLECSEPSRIYCFEDLPLLATDR